MLGQTYPEISKTASRIRTLHFVKGFLYEDDRTVCHVCAALHPATQTRGGQSDSVETGALLAGFRSRVLFVTTAFSALFLLLPSLASCLMVDVASGRLTVATTAVVLSAQRTERRERRSPPAMDRFAMADAVLTHLRPPRVVYILHFRPILRIPPGPRGAKGHFTLVAHGRRIADDATPSSQRANGRGQSRESNTFKGSESIDDTPAERLL